MVLNIKQNRKIRNKSYVRIFNKYFNERNNNKREIEIRLEKLKTLPSVEVINNNVEIFNSSIDFLPTSLRVINGYLLIYSSIIKNFSYLEVVNGSFYINHSRINKLPNNLKYVNGNLNISSTNIYELPKGLVVENNLNILNSKLHSYMVYYGIDDWKEYLEKTYCVKIKGNVLY